MSYLKRAFVAALCAVTFAWSQTTTDPNLTVDIVITGLSQPTCLLFHVRGNPNEFLVGEKASGQVKLVRNGSVEAIALDLPVANNSERGLLGIAMDPAFDTNRYVYIYYSRSTSDGGTWLDNRVSRFTWNPSASTLTGETLIISFPSDTTQNNGPNHDGGIIQFGPDDKLYGITGDLNRGFLTNTRIEQNTASATSGRYANVGGIFRINTNSTIPADNPFFAQTAPQLRRLWAYGIRNSFGMMFDSLTGRLWFTENGPNLFDEINIAHKGMNSGWLKIMGPDSRDATYAENGNVAYNANQLTILPNSQYYDPLYSWRSPIGVTSINFLRSARYEANIRDTALAGDANLGNLYKFDVNANRDDLILTGGVADRVADSSTERNLNRWGTGWGVITDMDIGADGYMYMTSLSNGAVYRLRPINPPTVLNGECRWLGYLGDRLGIPVTLDLFNGTTLVETIVVEADAFGKFSTRPAAPGNYTIVAKSPQALSKRLTGVTLPSGGYAYVLIDFDILGDANNDNLIDDSDLAMLLEAFGTNLPTTDFNGDGIVDDVDLSVLLMNFGLSGELP